MLTTGGGHTERRRDLILSSLDRSSNSDASSDELGVTGQEVEQILRHGLGVQPQWKKAGFTLPCRPAPIPQLPNVSNMDVMPCTYAPKPVLGYSLANILLLLGPSDANEVLLRGLRRRHVIHQQSVDERYDKQRRILFSPNKLLKPKVLPKLASLPQHGL
jgi:hypothetical protein